MSIERRRVKQMPKEIKEKETIASGILDENNARLIDIGIPGRGTIKIKITFEKEKNRLNETTIITG